MKNNNIPSLTAKFNKTELINAIKSIPDKIIYMTLQSGSNEVIITGLNNTHVIKTR